MSSITRYSPYSGVLHEAVEHNSAIYLSGVVAPDLSRDMFGQTADVLREIERRLGELGLDRTSILSATAYITDMSAKAQMNDAWTQFFAGEHLPSRATIGVSDLGPQVLVEVVVIAGR